MTVVISREFATNQTKYYNLAVNEEVVIKRGNNMFHLVYRNIGDIDIDDDEDDNDEDYITKDELLKGINEDLKIFFADKK